MIMGRGGGFVTAFSSEEYKSLDSPIIYAENINT